MAFAATEHELLSIIANECYAFAWILGSGAEVAESNISRAFNVMRAFTKQVYRPSLDPHICGLCGDL